MRLGKYPVRRFSPALYSTGGGGGGWTPTSLGSALRLWIKADTGVSATGGLIDSIADQSGNGFGLESNTTHRPTLNATGYNSHPSIDFSAASSTFLASCGIPAGQVARSFSMGNASSWFFIGKMGTGTSAYGRAMSYLGSTDALGGSANDYAATGSVAAILRDNSNNALSTFQGGVPGAVGSVSLNTNVRILMVFDNTNATLYVNNVQAAQTAFTFTLNSSGTIMLGGDLNGGSGSISLPTAFFDGTIAEALVTNTALDSTARSNLDAYAVARLGS